jgi:hypothetical protein
MFQLIGSVRQSEETGIGKAGMFCTCMCKLEHAPEHAP